MDVRRQGSWSLVGFDFSSLARCIPARWTRSGFERPYWLRSGTRRFELWERLLMNLAGDAQPPAVRVPAPEGTRWDGDVVVIGGGPAGVRAANEAVATGLKTCLVTRSTNIGSYASHFGPLHSQLDTRVYLLTEHEAAGVYRRGKVVLAAPISTHVGAAVLVCTRLVIATGRESVCPLVPGNDLPGVIDARTALRWAPALGAALGPAIVIGTGMEPRIAELLARDGVNIAMVASAAALEGILGRNAVRAAWVNGRKVVCRSVIHAGPWLANSAISFQARASGMLQLAAENVSPDVVTVGSAVAGSDLLPIVRSGDLSRVTVCACMDVSAREIVDRVRDGELQIEELKRVTGCGMGPCQGFPCWEQMRSLIQQTSGFPITDLPAFRPPCRTITVAQAAGIDGLLEVE